MERRQTKEMEKEIFGDDYRRTVGVIKATVFDNSISQGVRGRLKDEDIKNMISEYDERDKQARIYGKFEHLTGLIFKKFSREIHVIDPFQINKKDFVVIEALDPHPRNPDALTWLAIDRKGNKFVIDEFFKVCRTDELAANALKREDKYRIIERLADPLAFNEDKHTEPGDNLANRLYDDYGLDYQKASKTREDADRRIADALDYEEKGNEMLVAPELYIFNTCERTIYEFEHYQWDDWRGKAAERKNPKEKPLYKDEHTIENIGRILIKEYTFSPMRKKTRGYHEEEKTEKDFDPFL